MCAARMVMQHWARGYSNILLQAGLRLPLLSGYVDDGRQGSTVLRRGAIFDEEKKIFIHSDEQLREDNEKNEPDNMRMARICLPAMNSINSNLRFTTEAPEEFPKNRLPTLDFVLWMHEGLLYHSYFEKAMKMQYTILQRTAMSEHQKMSILSNELVRRLSTIHREVIEEEIEEVIEHYTTQLKNSDYSRKQAKEVVVCGIVGWRRKMERREKMGQGQYLSAEQTIEKRTSDKLLEKTSWFKGNRKRKIENAESKYKYNPPTKRRKKNRKQTEMTEMGDKQEPAKKIKGVMFVPYTKHSELAIRLRENEERMESLTGYKIKIVEKGGTKLVDMLHKANPWAGSDCKRPGCLLCTSRKEEGRRDRQDCKKRNLVSETSCRTCTERSEKEVELKYESTGR